MTNSCCSNNSEWSDLTKEDLARTKAVNERYGAAANTKEECLCTPVSFNTKFLEVIPQEIVDRDYGCGDPTKWVEVGDYVLDLGSGSGKNAFICAQIVGPSGHVIGVDRNEEMLQLSRNSASIVSNRIGYSNVTFLEGSIELMDSHNVDGQSLISSSSIDIILSNCVLNLVNPSARKSLLGNIKRVLKPGGRVAISDIVSDKDVPLELKKNSDLWSGCISGAWQEDQFLTDFEALGFMEVKFSERTHTPWKIIEGIEFRSVTLTGHLPK